MQHTHPFGPVDRWQSPRSSAACSITGGGGSGGSGDDDDDQAVVGWRHAARRRKRALKVFVLFYSILEYNRFTCVVLYLISISLFSLTNSVPLFRTFLACLIVDRSKALQKKHTMHE